MDIATEAENLLKNITSHDDINLTKYVLGTKTLHKVEALLSWSHFAFGVGLLFLAIALVAFVTSPYLTRLLYRGKFCR